MGNLILKHMTQDYFATLIFFLNVVLSKNFEKLLDIWPSIKKKKVERRKIKINEKRKEE